jgi:hypothetical protein
MQPPERIVLSSPPHHVTRIVNCSTRNVCPELRVLNMPSPPTRKRELVTTRIGETSNGGNQYVKFRSGVSTLREVTDLSLLVNCSRTAAAPAAPPQPGRMKITRIVLRRLRVVKELGSLEPRGIRARACLFEPAAGRLSRSTPTRA